VKVVPIRPRHRLTSNDERGLLRIADLDSVRISAVTCIRSAEQDPNEVTLSQATADALLLAGMVQYVSYRRVKITEKGRATVRRLTGGEP
jgi:Mn-dependent DtxR family transcriptional regulator